MNGFGRIVMPGLKSFANISQNLSGLGGPSQIPKNFINKDKMNNWFIYVVLVFYHQTGNC